MSERCTKQKRLNRLVLQRRFWHEVQKRGAGEGEGLGYLNGPELFDALGREAAIAWANYLFHLALANDQAALPAEIKRPVLTS